MISKKVLGFANCWCAWIMLANLAASLQHTFNTLNNYHACLLSVDNASVLWRWCWLHNRKASSLQKLFHKGGLLSNRRRKRISGQPSNPESAGKKAVRMVCERVCLFSWI